ncbi:HtaA domain-containing protein [Patulibacter sp. SYSU D01012]|uniref:HtaA domain-containing protein n=1 Tax=Patulibacter sp. SYSU D01012 TaxID=2817381 RepID=UPI001B315C83|nr:HtaA domain-containing protein [Patulibacter sp. SYSU D01012]
MRPPSRRSVVLLAPAAVAALAASGAAPAGATSTVAPTTAITVAKDAGKALRAPGLRVGATGSAWAGGRTVTVPVTGATAGTTPTVTHTATAGLRVRAGRRSVLVRGLRADLRAGTVRATVGRRAVTVFALRGVRVATAADGTRTAAATLRVSPTGARVLRGALRVRRLRAGTFGTLRVLLPAAVATPAPATPAPAPIVLPGPPTAPAAAAPAPTTPDASPAVEVVRGAPSLDWTILSSWIGYLTNGGGRVETAEGAGRTASGSVLFPSAGGAIAADGTGTVRYAGAVRFVQASHGIDMTFSDFSVTFGPTEAPVVRAVLVNRNGAAAGSPVHVPDGPGTRQPLDFGRLRLAEARSVGPEGDVRLYERVPVHLTAEAANPFGFYAADQVFGSMNVRAALVPPAPTTPTDPGSGAR